MASLSFIKTYKFLVTIVKKNILLLHIPIMLLCCIPLINKYSKKESSNKEGHALIAKLHSHQLNIAEFQKELAQLNKNSTPSLAFGIKVTAIVLIKFFIYWGAIIFTFLLGLSYADNKRISFPDIRLLGKTLIILFFYFFCIVALLFPIGFTITLGKNLMGNIPSMVLMILLGIFSLGLSLFLAACFSCSIPLILDTEEEIIKSARKSYRLCKHQTFHIMGTYLAVTLGSFIILSIASSLLHFFIPTTLYTYLTAYILAWSNVMGLIAFLGIYTQLTGKEIALD